LRKPISFRCACSAAASLDKHRLPRNPEQLASMRETGQQDQACNDDSRQVDGKKGRIHARDLRSGGSDRRMEKFRRREKFRTDYCAGMTICS
jgi:hypothetical protein